MVETETHDEAYKNDFENVGEYGNDVFVRNRRNGREYHARKEDGKVKVQETTGAPLEPGEKNAVEEMLT